MIFSSRAYAGSGKRVGGTSLACFYAASLLPFLLAGCSGTTGPAVKQTVLLTANLASPASVKVGTPTQVVVSLSSAAPAGGILFTLSVDNNGVASAPATVMIAEGANSASFYVTALSAGTTTLRAVSSNTTEADAKISASLTSAQAIQHVVVIFDENVSFDHYFGTYPVAANPAGEPAFVAATGTPTPAGLTGTLLTANPNSRNATNGAAAANPFRLDRAQAATADQDHGYVSEQLAFNNGAMDLFPYSVGHPDSAALASATGAAAVLSTNALTLGYYDGNTVTALWNYAQQGTLGDHFFETTFGPSTPGAINLISGQTNGAVDDGGSAGAMVSDGNGGYSLLGDPDPTGDLCSNASVTAHMTGKNIGDLLTAAGISWGFFQGGFDLTVTNPNYSTGCSRQTASLSGMNTANYNPHHQPFQYYASTANPNHTRPLSTARIGLNSDAANHQYDLHDFTDALAAGNMPAVSYLKAANYQDGHAGYSSPLDEQAFLVTTINAIQQSSFWNSTAIVIAYDDSDGWYDHMMNIVNGSATTADQLAVAGSCASGTATSATALPGVSNATAHAQGRCGYGPRLPLLVVSPWAKKNNVDSTVTDQTSILRFIEDTFLAGKRIGGGSFDSVAGALDSMFDFSSNAPQNPGVLVLDPVTGLVVSRK